MFKEKTTSRLRLQPSVKFPYLLATILFAILFLSCSENLKIFEAEDFSIRVPEFWTLAEREKEGLLASFKLNTDYDLAENMIITREDFNLSDTETVNLDHYVRQFREQSSELDQFREISSEVKNGIPFYIFEAQNDPSHPIMTFVQSFYIHEKSAFTLQCTLAKDSDSINSCQESMISFNAY